MWCCGAVIPISIECPLTPLCQLMSTANLIKSQKYLIVTEENEETQTKDTKKDVKTETPAPTLQINKLLMGRGGKGMKLKTLRTKLAYSFNNTGSVNTAFSTVVPVQPSAGTSWSSFAAIYEEVIVHGGVVKFNVSVTGSGTDPLGSNQMFAIAYNPMVSTAATSIAALQEFSQAALYGCDNITTNTTANGVFGCLPSSKHGLYEFRFKVPKGKSARSASAASTFSGEWSNTNDGSDVYGWVSPYASSPGANNTWSMYGVIIMDVSFRSRF